MNIMEKQISDIEYAKLNMEKAYQDYQLVKLLPDALLQLDTSNIGLYVNHGYDNCLLTGPVAIWITLHHQGEDPADIIQWSKQTMALLSSEIGVVWEDKPAAADAENLEYKGSASWIVPIHVTISKVPISGKSCTILKTTRKSESVYTEYEVYCPEEVAL